MARKDPYKLNAKKTKPRRAIKIKAKVKLLRTGKYKDTPYYSTLYCPKSYPQENIAWRLRWLEAAITDRGIQRDFKQAAFDDVLFFFNAFAWCFEPRATIKIRPFCTWPHQDPAIIALDKAISDSERDEAPVDVVVDKSRGQGATWMYLLIFLRRWLRDPMFSAGLVTRNEKLVDSLRDPDTLMWKIVWMINRLPTWMLPEGFDMSRCRNLSEHSLINPANGASIVGYSATGDVARGGRKSVFALDEFAAFLYKEGYAALNSTQHVTNCRFLVSTHLGDQGAYYDAATQDTNAVKVVLTWQDNPTQNAKLYSVPETGNKIFESDPKPGNKLTRRDHAVIRDQHKRLLRRGYKVKGKLRNTWYNDQCLRPGATPFGIAQELDRDPHGSKAKVFSAEVLRDAKLKYARPPLVQGNLVYDTQTARVRPPFINPAEMGELKLWVKPGLNGEMPAGSYVLGADIAAGTAGSFSSNSVACVINRMTGEQVAEWVSNSIIPGKFAYVCAALGRWFGNAELVPETNFGASYMKVLLEDIYYEHVYREEVDIEGIHTKTKKPGFYMRRGDTRLKLFHGMQEGMATGKFIPRSEALLKECPEYEYKGSASAVQIVHIGSTRTDDDSSKGMAHGDRVIAAALAWMRCDKESWVDAEETPEHIPTGSMAERLRDSDRELRQSGDPWRNDALDIYPSRRMVSSREQW